ncbi:MAG: XRE family transcriptional regulator [Pseudomonadota bacterium]
MSLLEKGTIVPDSGVDNGCQPGLAMAIAAALRLELKGRRAKAKIIGRWTGASERAIKNWLMGRAVPSGIHLVALMRHSDEVFQVVMTAARR